jgi:hypothetical protein
MRTTLLILATGLALSGSAGATSVSLGIKAEQHRLGPADSLAIEGQLVSASHGKVVVQTLAGPQRAVRVDGLLTRVTLDGKRARLRDLKPGQWVRASVPSRDDLPLAMHVDVRRTQPLQ